LKGHEDLRQDERVMQLFGLVNTLLKKDGMYIRRRRERGERRGERGERRERSRGRGRVEGE
jgi:hypothetical protein